MARVYNQKKNIKFSFDPLKQHMYFHDSNVILFFLYQIYLLFFLEYNGAE